MTLVLIGLAMFGVLKLGRMLTSSVTKVGDETEVHEQILKHTLIQNSQPLLVGMVQQETQDMTTDPDYPPILEAETENTRGEIEDLRNGNQFFRSTSIAGWTVYDYNDTSATRLYTRRAYLDARINNNQKWTVRIYAVVTQPVHSQFFCCLMTSQSPSCQSASAHVHVRSMKELTFEKRLIARVFITCHVSVYTRYTHVALTLNRIRELPPDVRPLPLVRPLSNQTEEFEHKLGLCVPLSYGHFSDGHAVRFIEWMETLVMFGVTEFNIYNVSMTSTPAFKAVLNHYKHQNLLRVFETPPPISSQRLNRVRSLYNVSKMADLVILNECVTENMYRYRHVIVVDLDEILVPRKSIDKKPYNIVSVLDDMGPTMQYTATFLVKSFMYFLDMQSSQVSQRSNIKEVMGNQLLSYKHTIRLRREEAYLDAKQITNPRLCAHVYMHYCDVTASFNVRHVPVQNVAFVSDNLMTINHYRKSCANQWRTEVAREREMFVQRCLFFERKVHKNAKHVDDLFMHRFVEEIWNRVQPVLEEYHLTSVEASPKRFLHVGEDLRFELSQHKKAKRRKAKSKDDF